MNIEAFEDNVVLKIEKKETTKSGIILPSDMDEAFTTATVYKITAELSKTTNLKEGEEVYIRPYGWIEIEEKDCVYLIGKKDGIVAKKT